MIKITHFQDSGKPDPSQLLLAIDVSSRTLDIYGRYVQNGGEFELSESISNNLCSIAHLLFQYSQQARVLGYSGLAFVLEPSGRLVALPTRPSSPQDKSLVETAV